MRSRIRLFSPLIVALLPCCALVGGIADLHTVDGLDDSGAGDVFVIEPDSRANVPEPSCTGLADGFYCGGHLLQGDPTVLYGCSAGKLAATRQCTAACVAEGVPPDTCPGDGGDGWPCSCGGYDENGALISTTECGQQFCADDHVYWTCRLAPGDNGAGMKRGTVPCN